MSSSVGDAVVLDASAAVDLLIGSELSPGVAERLRDVEVHSPAHVDAEVLSALGRLHRVGDLTTDRVADLLVHVVTMPVQRHLLEPLLEGAWERRGNLRLVDALYVELAERLDAAIVTTDGRLASATPRAVPIPGV